MRKLNMLKKEMKAVVDDINIRELRKGISAQDITGSLQKTFTSPEKLLGGRYYIPITMAKSDPYAHLTPKIHSIANKIRALYNSTAAYGVNMGFIDAFLKSLVTASEIQKYQFHFITLNSKAGIDLTMHFGRTKINTIVALEQQGDDTRCPVQTGIQPQETETPEDAYDRAMGIL